MRKILGTMLINQLIKLKTSKISTKIKKKIFMLN